MKSKKHEDLINRERRFPTGHRLGYKGFNGYIAEKREEFYREFLEKKPPKQPSVDEVIAAFAEPPPEKFASPYDVTPQGIEHLSKAVQPKYVVRFKNIRRSWANLLQYMPELMASGGPSQTVLEMSTAHGATLEILRDKGHKVVGNDFPNFLGRKGEGDSRTRDANSGDFSKLKDDHGFLTGDGTVENWPYKPLIDGLGLEVKLFDAGNTPYPFASKRFDSVICFDALEHYCHPRDWMTIINEFVRLARRSVLVICNPVQGQWLDKPDYMDPFHAFQKDMREYNQNGFECVHAGINRNQLTVWKLMKTGPD